MHADVDAVRATCPNPTLPSRASHADTTPCCPSFPGSSGSSVDHRLGTALTAPAAQHLRLSDCIQRPQDFHLWAQLVQDQHRRNGIEGVTGVWRALRERDIDIPTSGVHGEELWRSFIRAGFDSEPLAGEVLTYAAALWQGKKQSYAPFYEIVLEHWLLHNPADAYNWHVRLRDLLPISPGALGRLVRAAVHSKISLIEFRKIYEESQDRGLYDAMILSLCDKEDFGSALHWHQLCTSKGDEPSPAVAAKPMVKRLAAHGAQDSGVTHTLPHQTAEETQLAYTPTGIEQASEPQDASQTSISSQTGSVLTRELMSRYLGDAHNVKPKVLDDRFCARLFATRMFSVDLIINGVAMLGVESIGPLAVRELALREQTPDAFLRRLAQLKVAGISTTDSVYCKAAERFAAEGRRKLFDEMLTTDHDPNSFGDAETQQSLLRSCVASGNWGKVHSVLMILTVYNGVPSIEAWNLLLRALSRSQSSRSSLLRVIEDMRLHKVPVDRYALQALYDGCLRKRDRGRRVPSLLKQQDDIILLTGIWLGVLEAGGHVPPDRWREPLRRLGMTGRFNDLRRLTLWLAIWYSPQVAPTTKVILARGFAIPGRRHDRMLGMAGSLPPNHPSHPLQQLFSPALLKAIVAWGFISRYVRRRRSRRTYNSDIRSHSTTTDSSPDVSHLSTISQDSYHNWTRGLSLVRRLEVTGVSVYPDLVPAAVRQRLWMLFGPGGSYRKANRTAVARNRFTLAEMVFEAERIWGRPLFPLTEGLVTAQAATEKRAEGANTSETSFEGFESVAARRREEFLVAVFGEQMWVVKGGTAVHLRRWAKWLEARQRIWWIGI